MTEIRSEEWTPVTLGDLAFDINERVDNPSQSGYEHFVGLEHLTSGDFTIRNWGSTNDVTSSMKLFKKGDVLFGRRNTYLKRASMADFDGVCSGDAYVLRSNPDYLIDEFLPLILNTSDLWDYANAHSAGGMSKRAKWRDLENYSFHLPPKDEQRHIAEILWAAEDVIVKNEQFVAEAEHYKQLMMRELFHKGIGHTEFKRIKNIGMTPQEWNIVTIEDCCESSAYGPRFSSDLYHRDGNVAVLRTTDLDDEGNISYHTMPRAMLDPIKFKEHYLMLNDMVISRSGTCGITAIFSEYPVPVLPGAFLIRFRMKESININFLKYYLSSEIGKKRLEKLESGGVQKNLNGFSLLKFKIPYPLMAEQNHIVIILLAIDETITTARNTIESSKTLKMKLINSLLSPTERDEN